MTDIIPVGREHNPFSRNDTRVDSRGRTCYEGLPDTLIAALHARVDVDPEAEAVVELGGERLTYRQLWDRSARVAGGLRARGLARGDRVAIRYAAGVNWVLAFYGTIMAGGVVVAVNTRSAQPEVEFVLADSGTRIDLAADDPLPDGDPFVVDGLTASDTAGMFYTSGTTGSPKGVPTEHLAFLSNAMTMARTIGTPFDIGRGLRTLISVPLFHVTGCNSQLLFVHLFGGAAVIMPALDREGLLTALVEERISFLVTVPAVYALLLRTPGFEDVDRSSVQWVGYGGAPIAPSLVKAIQEGFPTAEVFNGYGMTETASLMTVLPHTDAVEHADSVGYAVPTVDLGVVPHDPADPTLGELVARGPNITSAYWNRPEATREAIDTEGWLRTGDIVRVDDAGRVRIVDRTKDIIIRGGENISSIEVESALVAAPGVLEAAVLAVPDDVMGEKVGAVVFGGEEIPDTGAVVEHCRAMLADFKVPQYLVITDGPLPRNAGGKLLKARLRASVEWGEPLR
ncbi:AMP-binding protein [Tsukamurella sp. 8F]|uniref:class I adenylate-forming enzyme family protein n=1 Tax=unclassified Tsukamurella TaxID=2633480 RepID=UPI0023B8BB4B|nr:MULTISPECIES: AMP-binding protein [unclassified Tsukamurella]MDF0529345.1 AMP-binding protein [Tsukamurella sp. 8J]MDF0587148.1 AMP-binding protein [Tsukamurella sp. 8F]